MINLTRNWWMIVLRGVIAILFGLSAFLWPDLTWLSLVLLFGVYALIDGVIAIATGFTHVKESTRWWAFVLEGLVSIGAGVVALMWPGLTTIVLIFMIGAWAILTGILEIAAAIRLRHEITNEWWLALGGLLSIAVGVMLILQPAAGGLAVIWIIGAYAITFGVLLILLGFRVRNWEEPTNMAHVTK